MVTGGRRCPVKRARRRIEHVVPRGARCLLQCLVVCSDSPRHSSEPTDFGGNNILRSTRKRFGALASVAGLLGSSLVLFTATAPIAGADTIQTNACLGVTGTFSDFPIPLTGSAAATPGVANPGSATLGRHDQPHRRIHHGRGGRGVDRCRCCDRPRRPSDSLANIGVQNNAGEAADNAGINQVTSAAGANKLRITGTNTVEGTQQVQNTAPITPVTFFVTADSAGGSSRCTRR